MNETMKQQFGLIRRPWGVFYVKDKATGEQTSLKTKDRAEALRLLQAKNDAVSQPHFNLALARVYINGADPKLATRTWQEVMEDILAERRGPTRRRWESAIKDPGLDEIRKLPLTETRAEHFYKAMREGKVSTNVYLRRIHNHALGMEWLLKSVIPRLQWPKPIYKSKRAVTLEEHQRIVEREKNVEYRMFYQLLWELGGSQTDVATLKAEDIDLKNRFLCYRRHKTGSVSRMHFGESVERLLAELPRSGFLFPRVGEMDEKHRANEFRRRVKGLGIEGVSLHSYRYAWAERALKCGYPERFAQQALGHNSKAVHHAYAKRAEVVVPSLDDWEKQWKENPQKVSQPAVVQVDFSPPAAQANIAQIERSVVMGIGAG